MNKMTTCMATLLALSWLMTSSCVRLTSPHSSPASPEYGLVNPTGRTILEPTLSNPVELPETLLRLTPAQVLAKLGHPTAVQFEAVDSTEVKLWTGDYTYEWPRRSGQDRWDVLSVRFLKGKVDEAYWLPS